MFSFFKSNPPAAPAPPQVLDNAAQGAQPAPPPTVKPGGQFSPKRIRSFVIIGGVLLLCFIVSTGQNTKPKTSADQKKAQDAATAAGNSTAIGSRDYANAVTQALKPAPGAPGGQYPGNQGQFPYANGLQPSIAPGGQLPAGMYAQYPAAYPGYYPPGAQTYPAAQPYPAGAYPQNSPSSPVPSGQGGAAPARDPQQEAKDAMQVDDDKREHDSLSAGLMVRSERLRRDAPAASSAPATAAPAPVAPTTVANTSAPFPPAGNPPAPRQSTAPAPAPPAGGPSALPDDLPSHNSQAQQHQQSASNRATGPTYKLFEGTLLETVLTNRLNSSFTGPVECMVTIDIWSHSRQHLLIPQGTKVLGEARRVTHIGQDRLAVVFHRLIMPDGYSVSLDNFTGLSQIGETGLSDKVNHHYVQMFGVSVALGAISGLAVRGANAGGIGVSQSSGDAFRQGFSQQLSQEGTQILDKYLNVLPTVIIREGIRVKVYLLDDLSLPAYDQHKMATDL